MTFIVNRKALEVELAALQVVSERKSTLPALSTVRMIIADGMAQLTATDLDMSLSTQVPAAGEPWAGCVPSKQLYELTRLLQADQLEMAPDSRDNDRIQIKCGRSRHTLHAGPIHLFPSVDIPQVTATSISGAVLSKAIKRALTCITTDASEHWMQGVALRSHDGVLNIVATNSRQFGVTEIPLDLAIDVLLPVRAATALAKLLADTDVTFGVGDNQTVFQQGKRSFVTRLSTAQFPDWRPLLPKSFQHNVTLDSEATQQALKLASVTAIETALIPIPLRLTIAKDELTIETTESERGHSSETLAIDCATLNGEQLIRGVNGAHFINFLSSDAKTVMSFNDDLRLVQLSYEGEPDYRYITMTLKA